ncbi:hypothetical protein [Natrialba aegyptia]|uniref:DNA polymerase sliding clamp n=1 Tax=Natrialba aegyptia DSM 13077 TaxID=1227491 RepID=M0B802_9EURY|nr:hypothetical protein [Natrialba aegyptia]ELZ05779.1 DNA polymerase sliding clamp [Natrialba aegyptia DSM 13077]
MATTTHNAELDMYQVYLKGDVETTAFHRAIHTLGMFADAYRLEFTETSIDARLTDPSNTLACGVSVPIDYQTDHESVTIGVEHEDFDWATRFIGTPETATLRLNDGEERIQIMAGNGLDEAALVDPDSIREYSAPPEVLYQTTATLEAQAFKAAVGAVSSPVDAGLQLQARNGSLTLSPESSTDDWTIDAEIDGEDSVQAYSQSYLTDIASALPPEGDVTISFGADNLLRVSIGAACRETASAWFVLAPRLPEDDS